METIEQALDLFDVVGLVVVIATAIGSVLWDLVRSWRHPQGGPTYVLKRLAVHLLYAIALLAGLCALFALFVEFATVDGAVPGFAIAVAMLAWSLYTTLWLVRISPRLTPLPSRMTSWPSRDDLYFALVFSASLAALLLWKRLSVF